MNEERIVLLFTTDDHKTPVVCRRAHALFSLFVFVCTYCVVFCFVFLRLVCPMLPVSLDCLLLIAPSVFSNVYVLAFQKTEQHRF